MLQFAVGDPYFYCIIKVKNGIITQVVFWNDKSTRVEYQRDGEDFLYWLKNAIDLICAEKPGVFMSLYREIKDDELCFPLAEELRACKAQSQNKIFQETD